MELTIEHLAPYYPYRLSGVVGDSKKTEYMMILSQFSICTGTNLKGVQSWFKMSAFKPYLRPLSDLTKEIEHNGEKLVPLRVLLKNANFDLNKLTEDKILDYESVFNDIDFMSYNDVSSLCSWHFDIFGLIESGLAINYNEINK